jgi:hypothetical protein
MSRKATCGLLLNMSIHILPLFMENLDNRRSIWTWRHFKGITSYTELYRYSTLQRIANSLNFFDPALPFRPTPPHRLDTFSPVTWLVRPYLQTTILLPSICTFCASHSFSTLSMGTKRHPEKSLDFNHLTPRNASQACNLVKPSRSLFLSLTRETMALQWTAPRFLAGCLLGWLRCFCQA